MLPLAELTTPIAAVSSRRRFRQHLHGALHRAHRPHHHRREGPTRVNEIIEQIRGTTHACRTRSGWSPNPGRHRLPRRPRIPGAPGTPGGIPPGRPAPEYSRIQRVRLGLNRPDIKIIFNDDDVTLTQAYIERAFTAGHHVCEDIITPRTHYAIRPSRPFPDEPRRRHPDPCLPGLLLGFPGHPASAGARARRGNGDHRGGRAWSPGTGNPPRPRI